MALMDRIMGLLVLIILCCISPLSFGETERAQTPPRGWNSYDSFTWIISEGEFIQNAQNVAQKLLPYGYEYVVVDYLWYRRKAEGAYADSRGLDVIDEWGRVIPDPKRWPSSKSNKGFYQVADEVHRMGLKFGIHVMRGISTQAFDANTPILDVKTGQAYEESGRKWYTKDIGIPDKVCRWMKNGFMSVNTTLGAGRAFLRSLYHQYHDWGIDFVKHDCVFGADLNLAEITFVSQVLGELERPILYSLSPGSGVTSSLAKQVSGLVNMYRITDDDWDSWTDILSHVDITRNLGDANMIGAKGLKGKSWPDSDMLPLGFITDQGSTTGPYRKSNLTFNEQRVQMTMWSILKSPLMFGGDMRQLDESTFRLLSNPTLLEINSFSSNNKWFNYPSSPLCKQGNQHLPDGFMPADVKLGFTDCSDAESRGWYVKAVEDDLEQVCWKGGSDVEQKEQFCLYKRTSRYSRGEEVIHKLQLLETSVTDACLVSSPNKKLASEHTKRGSFSPCKSDLNQMWELTENGTLMSSYSGLCASVQGLNDYNGPKIPAWVATGRSGEIYLAFFNTGDTELGISMSIQEVKAVVPVKYREFGACRCREEWSGKDYGAVKDSFTAQVVSHGCALFVLKCS